LKIANTTPQEEVTDETRQILRQDEGQGDGAEVNVDAWSDSMMMLEMPRRGVGVGLV
jgi:hypothetical protein